MADERARLWTCIVYPESAPPMWRDILDEDHIQWVESPLHDKDVNPDGEVKKPHWHILLSFDGNKSFSQIREYTDKLNAPIPQKCASAKGLVRYMIHLDNPEKYQYDYADIVCHGGYDINDLFKITATQRYIMVGEIMDFVVENDIIEFSELVIYARHNRFEDWFPLLCDSCAYIVGDFIKSYRHSWRHKRKIQDKELEYLKDPIALDPRCEDE